MCQSWHLWTFVSSRMSPHQHSLWHASLLFWALWYGEYCVRVLQQSPGLKMLQSCIRHGEIVKRGMFCTSLTTTDDSHIVWPQPWHKFFWQARTSHCDTSSTGALYLTQKMTHLSYLNGKNRRRWLSASNNVLPATNWRKACYIIVVLHLLLICCKSLKRKGISLSDES